MSVDDSYFYIPRLDCQLRMPHIWPFKNPCSKSQISNNGQGLIDKIPQLTMNEPNNSSFWKTGFMTQLQLLRRPDRRTRLAKPAREECCTLIERFIPF
jgi:hypothetical protein